MKRNMLLVLILMPISLAAQSQPTQAKPSGGPMPQPPTSRQFLLDHGIDLKPESLQAALENPDPVIRGAAAMELATEKITSSAPKIKEALIKETDPVAKLRLASSLTSVSPDDGKSFMIELCQDLSNGKRPALAAARALMLLDRQGTSALSCVPTLMTVLRDSSDPPHQADALSALTIYRPILQDSSLSEIQSLSLSFMKSKNFTMQIAAAKFLAAEGSGQSIDAVRQAIAAEPNSDHRALMTHALQSMGR